MVKKVLIIGASAKEYALAKKISNENCKVSVAPGNKRIADIAECIDIREENTKDLLEYVLENAIDLTIASSETSIKSDISSLFQNNGQNIFAPTLSSCDFAISRAAAKKILYKKKIQAPRFGIFDKLSAALDYLKKASMPQVIYSDISNNCGDRLVCTTYNSAKIFAEDLFAKGESKIVLEDYVYGHEFTLYAITDGYHTVPLACAANYKFMEDCDGGILTDGVGAYLPDYKISLDLQSKILNEVLTPVLSLKADNHSPYMGIIGVDCVLRDDGSVSVLNFKPFLSDHDAQAVLSLVEDDLINVFEACINGSFEDYNQIKISDNSSVSCVVFSRIKDSIINGFESIDSEITPFSINKNQYLEYETIEGKNFVITKTSSTLSRARKCMYDDLAQVNFNGKKYRKDICEQVEKF